MTAQQRYKATVTTTADSLTQTLQGAIDSGFLSDGEVPLATSVSSSSITMAQAVRRLTALSAGFISGTDPQIEISAVSGTIGRWLSNTDLYPISSRFADRGRHRSPEAHEWRLEYDLQYSQLLATCVYATWESCSAYFSIYCIPAQALYSWLYEDYRQSNHNEYIDAECWATC
jgi:hypothetical protein